MPSRARFRVWLAIGKTPAGISVMMLLQVEVLIGAPQLEQGLVATDYIETTSSTAQAGILEDTPRLDYSGGASCPALLLEPQRTNSICLQSEYFDVWTLEFRKILAYIIIMLLHSPQGVQNASLM